MRSLLTQLLFQLEPETAHGVVKVLAKITPSAFISPFTQVKSPILQAKIGNTPLENPIGLAAGFDKNGDMIPLLEALEFGFLELGSISAFPCQGNPKPRIFRLLEDQALINRMGLPNIGADAFLTKMRAQKTTKPFGVNIVKTPNFALNHNSKIDGIDDFLQSFTKLYELGNYMVLNLSCPNTNETKTFESPELFLELARAIASKRKNFPQQKPVLIKLSPDLELNNLRKIVELACQFDLDGFVLTNTTTRRDTLKTSTEKIQQIGRGGLSGTALTQLANEKLKSVYDMVGNKKIIMAVGGIMSFEDLLTKLKLGASLFQVYTGMIYHGPFFIKKLNRELVDFCERIGVQNYSELIGRRFTHDSHLHAL